jgi:hypothetical protein
MRGCNARAGTGGENAVTEHAPIATGDERWPRIAVGLTLASLAAGYTLALELFWPALPGVHLPGIGFYLLLTGFLAFVLIGLLAALPAVYLISLAEARRWRSAAYYAVAGVGIALLWLGIFLLFLPGIRFPGGDAWGLVLQASLPGLIGGLVHWWIAGRAAGTPRHPVP